MCIRWYAAYPLSYRHFEEMIAKSVAFVSIIPPSTAGRSGLCPCLRKCSTSTSARLAAALRFFEKAMKANGVPEKDAMDKSGANKAARNAEAATGEVWTAWVEGLAYLPPFDA